MYDRFEYNGTITDYPSRTEWYWITCTDNDYSDFNFDYHVPAWESDCVQVFGDQHARDSRTYLVNARHNDDSPWQFHEHTVSRTATVPVFHATNLQPNESEGVRMFSNFFNFIKRCCNKTDAEYFWVTSSVCDYTNFDFTWHPDIGEEKFLHTWQNPSNKYGYTFYVPRKEFEKQMNRIQLLEWFEFVKYQDAVPVKDLPVNVFDLSTTCAEAIKQHTFTHHYEWFVEATHPMKDVLPNFYPARWDDINIEVFGKNQNVLCVPREAKSFVLNQVYDYPHINFNSGKEIKSKFPIYFFSYEEINAEKNYNKLVDRGLKPIRIHGVSGMVNAYKTAAEMCRSPYFWAVFAKSEVVDDFKFDYEPDRLAESKCYGFDSYIPLNGLTYGGYGLKLYPTKIVREITQWGADFSTSMPFEHVKILSTVANFNQSPYMTWRTAFRECAKISAGVMKNRVISDDENRLNTWCSVADGDFAEYCLEGARMGKQFGLGKTEEQIMCLYDEDWVKQQFISEYSDLKNPVPKTN